ncbi:hypothetical protein [Cribrihabitans pelagius]|uniref:hypothetical protein n=1 Tax=Cribrihabitans pelagius TaxID=1765746 RepID=UPI003B5C07B1
MKHFLLAALCAGSLAALAPGAAGAGVIENACRQSNRSAPPALCGCIQQVASHSLTRAEQRTVSKWFRDPHQAQVVRQSSRRSDERLWLRYKAFGATAARACG